jgi:hypothetical protein
VLIDCKHKEHNVLKQIINLKKKMILATQRWTKFFEDLQVIIRLKIACNGKMCKNKWNCLNGDYKEDCKLSYKYMS